MYSNINLVTFSINKLKIKQELKEAITKNNFEATKKIIESKSFDLNLPLDMNGSTCLHYAVIQNNEKLVEYICCQMKDINIRDYVSINALLINIRWEEHLYILLQRKILTLSSRYFCYLVLTSTWQQL